MESYPVTYYNTNTIAHIITSYNISGHKLMFIISKFVICTGKQEQKQIRERIIDLVLSDYPLEVLNSYIFLMDL